MKKFIFLFALIAAAITAKGQASTIEHYGTEVHICFDHGDTIPVTVGVGNYVWPGKSVTYLELTNGKTYKLDPDDFSAYASNNALWTELSHMLSGNITVKYNAATDPDTGWNMYGDDTLSYFLLPKNANDSIVGTGQSIPF